MKKSTLIVIIGTIAAVITLAAADLKIKKEYTLNHIKEYRLYKPLPEFHYIKDNYTGKREYEWYVCNIHSGADRSGAGVGFDAERILDFVVKNDTLFIQKPADATINDIAYGIPVTIFTKSLKGISSHCGWMNIDGKISDNFMAHAVNKAQIKFDHIVSNSLAVHADNTASVAISSTDTLQHIDLDLKSTSSFSANNVYIVNKTFHLSDSAAIRLSGRSLENFGVLHQ